MSLELQVIWQRRFYVAVIHPDKVKEPMGVYCQIYRMRIGGAWGLQLTSTGEAYWRVWQRVRDEHREKLSTCLDGEALITHKAKVKTGRKGQDRKVGVPDV